MHFLSQKSSYFFIDFDHSLLKINTIDCFDCQNYSNQVKMKFGVHLTYNWKKKLLFNSDSCQKQ